MNDIDFSFLKEPTKTKTALRLEILPLAALSMTSGVAGSYYKSDFEPSKKMLCGLLENYLGWHLSAKDRKDILSDVKKLRKKSKTEPITGSFEGSNYQPLIWDYLEITSIEKPKMESYDDYWSRAFRRVDAINHAKGTFQASHEAVIAKRSLPRDEDGKLVAKDYEDYFKLNYGLWPMYYSTPTQREYIYAQFAEGDLPYVIEIEVDSNLANRLLETEGEPCYLGTSEGWVDLKIKAA